MDDILAIVVHHRRIGIGVECVDEFRYLSTLIGNDLVLVNTLTCAIEVTHGEVGHECVGDGLSAIFDAGGNPVGRPAWTGIGLQPVDVAVQSTMGADIGFFPK